MKTFRDEGRADKSDVASVEKLLKSDLKDHVLFYQPLGKDQPLIIVLQSAYQQSKLEQYGKSMVFLDATYSGKVVFFGGVVVMVVVCVCGGGGRCSTIRNTFMFEIPVWKLWNSMTNVCNTCLTEVSFWRWFIVGLTSYRYAVYALVARDSHGHGFPLSYMILSTENTALLQKALAAFSKANPSFCPRYFDFIQYTAFGIIKDQILAGCY